MFRDRCKEVRIRGGRQHQDMQIKAGVHQQGVQETTEENISAMAIDSQVKRIRVLSMAGIGTSSRHIEVEVLHMVLEENAMCSRKLGIVEEAILANSDTHREIPLFEIEIMYIEDYPGSTLFVIGFLFYRFRTVCSLAANLF